MTCSLSPTALRSRKLRIAGLLTRGLVRLTPIEGGVRAEFAAGEGIAAEVESLVALEAECCPSLRMSVDAGVDGLALEVTGPPSAQELIAELLHGRRR